METDKKFYVLMYGDKFYAPYHKGDAMFYKYTYIEDMLHDDITFAVRFGNKELAARMLRLDSEGRTGTVEPNFDSSLSKVVEVDCRTLEMKDVELETEE